MCKNGITPKKGIYKNWIVLKIDYEIFGITQNPEWFKEWKCAKHGMRKI